MADPIYKKLNVASVYIEDKRVAEKLCALATYELLATQKDVYYVSFYDEKCEKRDKLSVYCVEIVFDSKKKDIRKIYVDGKRICDYGLVVIENLEFAKLTYRTQELDSAALIVQAEFESMEEEYRCIALLANANKFGGVLENFGFHYAPSTFSENKNSSLIVYTRKNKTKNLIDTLNLYGEVFLKKEKQVVYSYYADDTLLYHQVESIVLSKI